MLNVKSKVWLEKDGKLAFGIGKTLILKAIDETGSINKAAKRLNMSYRRAWSYIQSAEQKMNRKLLIKVKGGAFGGGAVLTDFARELLKKYEAFEQKTRQLIDHCYKETFVDAASGKTIEEN